MYEILEKTHNSLLKELKEIFDVTVTSEQINKVVKVRSDVGKVAVGIYCKVTIRGVKVSYDDFLKAIEISQKKLRSVIYKSSSFIGSALYYCQSDITYIDIDKYSISGQVEIFDVNGEVPNTDSGIEVYMYLYHILNSEDHNFVLFQLATSYCQQHVFNVLSYILTGLDDMFSNEALFTYIESNRVIIDIPVYLSSIEDNVTIGVFLVHKQDHDDFSFNTTRLSLYTAFAHIADCHALLQL